MDETGCSDWELAHCLVHVAHETGHDVGNALAVIVGRSQLALRDAEDAGLREDLSAILESARQASEMTRRLKRYAGAQEASFGPLDANALVRQVGSEAKALWKGRGKRRQIRLLMEAQDGLPELAGDGFALKRALDGLVANAVEAMPGKGTVTLRTQAYPQEIVILVEDTGKGMDLETLQRAKEPFFTTKGPPHRGIGLSVASGVALRHGGGLDVAAAPGAPTRVSLHLPRNAGPGG